MTRFRWVLLTGLLIGLASLAILPANAQDSINDSLKQAIQFLSKQIGKPIPVVDNYTYESMNFQDEAMGCPETGKNYPALVSQGYKFLLTVTGITYDVRITLDGNHARLCSGDAIKQTATLALYRSPLFSIPYPDRWHPTDRGSDIFFGLSPSPVCSQPGMTVSATGQVAVGKSLDDLLNDYAQTTSGAQFDTNRISVGNIGRSVLFTASCTDGSARQNRVTVFMAYGKGYRVVQFAPQIAFNQWADVFMNILQKFSPASGGGSGDGQAVTMPQTSPLALIGHIFEGNVYVGTLVDLPGTALTDDAASDHTYRDVVVSPKGDLAAFIDTQNASLYVTSVKGDGTLRKLADKLAPVYPVAWKPDASEIAYLVDTGNKDGDREVYSVMAVKVDGGEPRKIGDTQGIRIGCKANTTDPAELQYWIEAGTNGNRLLLSWMPDGMLYYSLGCDGVGVGQIVQDGSKRDTVDAGLKQVQISPDGSQLLGIDSAGSLVNVKLSDHSVTKLTTAAPPEQVAWSPDGKFLYYSTAVVKDTIKLDSDTDKDRGLKAFGVWPFQTITYGVELHRLNLTANQDLSIYQATGRGLGHIAPSPDGSGVLFTFVQDASNLVQAFKNNVSAADLRREAPATMLYWLSFATPQPQLLAITLDPTWGPLGSALAPTPTGSTKETTPAPVLKPTQTPPPAETVPPTNTRVPTTLPQG